MDEALLPRANELLPAQEETLNLIEVDDPKAKVIGWHYELEGPLLVRGDERWQVVQPDGHIATVADTIH